MVAVPAHGAGDVQDGLIHEAHHGAQLGGDDLGGMEVARVQGIAQAVLDGVAHRELVAGHGEALHADAEQLALQAAGHVLLADGLVGEDFIQRSDHALAEGAGSHAGVLHAVGHPVVDGAGLSQLLGELIADLAAALAVLDPELAHVRLRAGQGQIAVHHGMGKIGGVEVQADLVRLGPVHPVLEFGDGVFIAIDLLAVLFGVAGVQVQLGGTGNHGAGEIDVRAQLLGVAGAARIVAGGLDAARQAVGAVEADHVVALPAVHGHRHRVGALHRGLNVHADGGVGFLGIFITLQNVLFVHVRSSRSIIC